jgi:phage terminase large subunit
MTGFAQQGGEVRSSVTGRVLYAASPKQLAYHNSPAIYPLFGGSKGCGKSICLRWDHYLPSLAMHAGGGRMHSLILRRKLVDLQRSHLRFVPEEAQAIGAQWKPSDVGAGVLYIPNERTPNHSLIEFGHCQHETDVDQYLSAQYDRQSFDELVTFSENQYLTISSCCRTTVPGLVPRVGGATNPGGKSARWVKRRWIDRDLTDEDDETYDPNDYAYIPALPTDNPFLNWTQYMRQLNRLPPEMRRAYRDGDWNIFIGQFFPEFRKTARPDKDGALQPPHVVEFPDAPREWPRYGGLDWGYASEGAYLWLVQHPDGFLDVEDEFIFNGEKRDKQIAKEVAQAIVRRNAARGIKVRRTYADPSMGEARGHESVETYVSTFKKHGVPCELADNDRESGWARVRAWLRPRPDGLPFLRVHPRCAYLTRTFGEVVMDEKQPELMDSDGPDHALDALRYVIAARPQAPGAAVSVDYPAGSAGDLKRQLMAAGRGARVLGTANVRRRR